MLRTGGEALESLFELLKVAGKVVDAEGASECRPGYPRG